MDKGAVVQVGTPAEVYEYPRTRFVADFFGTANLIEGAVTSQDRGMLVVSAPELGADLLVDDVGRYHPGQKVWVAVRPEKIRISKEPETGARRNLLKGVVWELGYLGNRSIYQVKTDSGKVLSAFAQNERRTLDWSIDWGDEVYLSWDAEASVLLES
jgi:putrescine transport system ATP-binding protein